MTLLHYLFFIFCMCIGTQNSAMQLHQETPAFGLITLWKEIQQHDKPVKNPDVALRSLREEIKKTLGAIKSYSELAEELNLIIDTQTIKEQIKTIRETFFKSTMREASFAYYKKPARDFLFLSADHIAEIDPHIILFHKREQFIALKELELSLWQEIEKAEPVHNDEHT